MPKHLTAEEIRDAAAARKRVQVLLEMQYAGNQRRLASAAGVSQALISMVVTGRQRPGRQLLEALGRLPGVDPAWVVRGIGQPLLPVTTDSLPIAFALLPGPPSKHPELFTGLRHPVAADLRKESRYWLGIPAHSQLTTVNEWKLLNGDLLLMETSGDATCRPELVLGKFCGVRLEPPTGVVFVLGMLSLDAEGVYLLTGAERIESPLLPPVPPAPKSQPVIVKKLRRKVMNLKLLEERKEEMQRKLEKQGEIGEPVESVQPASPPIAGQDLGAFAGHIVAVCLYLARPFLGSI